MKCQNIHCQEQVYEGLCQFRQLDGAMEFVFNCPKHSVVSKNLKKQLLDELIKSSTLFDILETTIKVYGKNNIKSMLKYIKDRREENAEG